MRPRFEKRPQPRATLASLALGLIAILFGLGLASTSYAELPKLVPDNPTLPVANQIPEYLGCQIRLNRDAWAKGYVDGVRKIGEHKKRDWGPSFEGSLLSMTFDTDLDREIKGIGAYESRGLHYMLARVAKDPSEHRGHYEHRGRRVLPSLLHWPGHWVRQKGRD